MKRLLLVISLFALVGCHVSENRARQAFLNDYRGFYPKKNVQVLEVVPYRGMGQEQRFRIVGGIPDPDAGNWMLVWADYGQVRHQQWIALEYPLIPFTEVSSRAEAEEAAAAYRREFEKARAAEGAP